jgi:O-antigen/teichoic acid export membrane protein
MRYEKKPKLYFVLTNVQLMIRILSTVLFVAVFKLGVTGVILGHIVGETSSVLMFGFVLRNYFGLYLSKFDLKAILGFSLPLVPAVLIISFQKPLIRYLVVNYLSIIDLGYYTIALQIAGILSFVQFGLKMSWQPHLFELLQNDHYESEVKKIYNLFLGIAGLVCFLIITNGRLLLQILTTPSYYSAAPIIGFVVMDSLIEIIRQISGCGPAVAKKTQYETYYELCASVVSILFFLAFYKYIGIIGLAIAFLGGTLIKFVLSWILTRKFTDIRIDALPTCLLLLFLLSISIIYAVINISIVTSIVFSILVGGAYFYVKKSEIFNGCKYINGKISRAIAIKRN